MVLIPAEQSLQLSPDVDLSKSDAPATSKARIAFRLLRNKGHDLACLFAAATILNSAPISFK
jgi:hypothetical protein